MGDDEFEAAVAAAGKPGKDPGSDAKLKLYALYKQATEGDVSGKRPGMMDFVGRAKYDAWAQCKGMSGPDARADYIARVNALNA